MGWKALQAVRYRNGPASGEFSLPHVSRHGLVLTIRPAERLEVQYEGVKLDRPPVAGSINVIPAGSSVLWRRQGSIDALFIHLEPSLVARVAAESFGFDSSRTVLPPLYGLTVWDQGTFVSTPLQTNLAFSGGFAALRSLRDELNNMRRLVQGLPPLRRPAPETKPHSDFLPTIDWFWVKIGIKAGLAAVISILLLMWINPPGPALIPLAAWILTVFLTFHPLFSPTWRHARVVRFFRKARRSFRFDPLAR